MKNINMPVIVMLILAVLLVPLAAIPESKAVTAAKATPAAAGFVESSEKSEAPPKVNQNTYVRLYNTKTKAITKINLKDYIFGVVAGEIPQSYADEAIKAQILAAKSYTLYRMGVNAKEKYDVTNDSETSQNYIDRKTALKNWGSAGSKYDKRLNSLIDSVWQYAVLYKNKPILAVYHAISSGTTESSKNVWQSNLAYLQPVDSVGDKLADGYLTEVSVSISDANAKLKPYNFTAKLLKDGKSKKTEYGNVLEIASGKNTLTGGEICRLFSLRSQNFDISLSKTALMFTVRGFGHQVGLSQNGANYMAKGGSTCKEILEHYYKGAVVKEYS